MPETLRISNFDPRCLLGGSDLAKRDRLLGIASTFGGVKAFQGLATASCGGFLSQCKPPGGRFQKKARAFMGNRFGEAVLENKSGQPLRLGQRRIHLLVERQSIRK